MEQAKLLFEDVDDPTDEDLGDLTISPEEVSSTVLYNTDWTVETITSQLQKHKIDLTPSFQRRDAWSLDKKGLLIESILLNFPIPPLTLAEKGSSKTYIVVDGKQRLTTLAQFFGLLPGATNNNFKLKGLEQLKSLNGLDCTALSADRPDMFTALENYTIRTNVIRGWKRDDVLYSIFLRLNSGSVKLSPQELRQALKPGPFSDFMIMYTETSPALRSIFPGFEPDFRMRDLELLLRYLGLQFFLSDYRGQLKRFLDIAAERFNSNWTEWEGPVRERIELFENAYAANIEIFGQETAFRKWTGDHFENRLNRAVFDVEMFYLRTQENIDAYKSSGDTIRKGFTKLCAEDNSFREAIEATTKSIDAVSYRLSAFGGILKNAGVIKNAVVLEEGRTIRYHATN